MKLIPGQKIPLERFWAHMSVLIGHGSANYCDLLVASNQRVVSIDFYKITEILRALSLVKRVAKPMFYCTGKHPVLEYGRTRWGEASSSLMSYFGLFVTPKST